MLPVTGKARSLCQRHRWAFRWISNVTARGADVAFAMPGIPGNPEFKGKLATDAKTITGDFTQGGQTLAFRLERKAAKPKQTAETPAKGVPGQGLAGAWQGSLKVSLTELRLVLKVSKSGEGKLTGTMDSIDQGARDIPIDTIDYKEDTVHLELKKIGGTYDGKISEKGTGKNRGLEEKGEGLCGGF